MDHGEPCKLSRLRLLSTKLTKWPSQGRAGYGGSLEGNWPYAYEACDVGTLANQTDGTVVLPAGSGDQVRGFLGYGWEVG